MFPPLLKVVAASFCLVPLSIPIAGRAASSVMRSVAPFQQSQRREPVLSVQVSNRFATDLQNELKMDSLAELHLQVSMNYFEEDACYTLTDEKETRFRLVNDEGSSPSVDGHNLTLEVSESRTERGFPSARGFSVLVEDAMSVTRSHIQFPARSASFGWFSPGISRKQSLSKRID